MMLRMKHRRLALLSASVLATTLLAGCSGQSGSTDGGAAEGGDNADYTIALSNSYLGNSWRQTMVKAFEATAGEAKKQGIIKDFSVSNTSQNTATEQIAQIKSLILKKPSAILINSASPTGLNSVIEQACSAGITVVVFDSLASADCEYDVVNGLEDFGYQEAKLVAEAMGGKGNVLMVRGVVGSAPETQIHDGQLKALKEYPDIKVVKELVGQASDSVTQEAVQSAIPSLPQIDGVISGGSSFGAVQAFDSAGLPLPRVAFDNSGESLRFWKDLVDSQGYQSGSVRTDPGQASAAVWIAIALLNGEKVPKTMHMPNVVITEDNLQSWIDVTPTGNVAAWLWTQEQTEAAITTNQDKGTVEPLPVPTTAP